MRTSARFTFVASAAIVLAGLSLPATAQQPNNPQDQHAPGRTPPSSNHPATPGHPPAHPHAQVRPQVHGRPPVPNRVVVVGHEGYRFGRPGVRRDIHTFSERERFAWQHGHWLHERRFGRDGWWWEVNGAWYWYPQPFEGPPAYVSEYEGVDEAADEGYPAPPPGAEPVEGYPPPPAAAAYPPPPGAYAPPPGAYAPPPPPPPPPAPSEAVGGAIGGAIIGGVLGGALTGRAGGAAAGAIIGGATGAAIGADAERRRNGYYWWHGGCYYRYPSGEYALIAPGYCS